MGKEDSSGVYSCSYDPNPSHPTTAGPDDSMAFPSSPASKGAGDGLVGSPAGDMEPSPGQSPATSVEGGFGRTTQQCDYSVPDGKAEIYSPERGLTGQTPK